MLLLRFFIIVPIFTEVNLSKFTTSIGVQSFYGCANLKELKLPNTVEKIDLAAFENSGLAELHCRAITPPVVNRSFGYRGKVLVPYRSLELYKQAEGWKDCAFGIKNILKSLAD